jgi:glycosyltransferase involved in cell wall biosynthesis
MNIHLHLVAHNESKILPFTLDYYSQFCSKIFVHDNFSTDNTKEICSKYDKVTVLDFFTDNEYDDVKIINLKNTVARQYSSDCDYVIVCDSDEFLYHPNLIQKLEQYHHEKVEVPYVIGHQMVSECFPEYDGKLLTEKIKIGSDVDPLYSKSIIFKPKINLKYDCGAHQSNSDRFIRSSDKELKLLHYKFLGKEYVTEVYKERANRRSELNKKYRWGYHFNEVEKTLKYMDELLSLNKQVIN